MEHTMNYLRRVVLPLLIAIFAACALVAPPAAQAHTGDHPHVAPAVFKSSDDVAVELGPAVSVDWKFNAVVINTDDRLGPPPDFHVNANCEAHPNWGCIKVSQVNQPGEPYILTGYNNVTDQAVIQLNVGGDFTPQQAGSCRAFGAVLDVHEHLEMTGCMRIGYDTSDTLFSPNEMNALRDAYRRN